MSNEAQHLAGKLRDHAERVAKHHDRPPQIAKVIKATPLAVETVHGSLSLDHDDLVLAQSVKADPPKKGEYVVVAQLPTEEFFVMGTVADREPPSRTMNTVLNGEGPPAEEDGVVGDFYIDTETMTIYGPKT